MNIKRKLSIILTLLVIISSSACRNEGGSGSKSGGGSEGDGAEASTGGSTASNDKLPVGNIEEGSMKDYIAMEEIGVMLTLTAVDESQSSIVNDSGMNGTGGRIHLHSNTKEDMYKGNNGIFVFDAGHIEKLGKMYLWNYNAPDDTQSGIKDVYVSFSEDNASYSEPVKYPLAQASGEDTLEAANLDAVGVIDFLGKSGRYIKLEAESNYGGDGFGLSEVRLFRYKQDITVGKSISCSPLERYINNKWCATPEDYNFLNGSGLSDSNSALATHDNKPEHMFAQTSSAFDFTIDLKGQYPLSKLVIWNYNDKEHLDYGLAKFRLKISDDYSSWKTIGTYTVNQADGSEQLPPSLTIDFEGEVRGHYIKLEILSNYGGDKVGLSEVSVFLGEGWYTDKASDYTALFSNYEGWAGADGIYSASLDGLDYDYGNNTSGKKVFLVFSDTIMSSVNPVTKLRSGVYMPNNTSAILTGTEANVKNITYVYPEKGEATANIVPNTQIPATKAGKFIYYWLGDTFVTGGKLYVFCLRIDSIETGFGFDQVGVDLACYDIKNGNVDYDSLRIIDDGGRRLCDVSDASAKWYMGGAVFESTKAAGVLNPDGYVYIYGYQDKHNIGRELIVSRVKPENIENFEAYEYLGSSGEWLSAPPSDFMSLAHDIAPECSVTQIQDGEYRGWYLFVNTHYTNTPEIKASISETPYGVFSNKTTIYVHDDHLTTIGKGNNTYNAKAHPVLSNRDEIIISYNINGDDCFTYADIYRPRFIRLAQVKKAREA